MKMLNGLFVGTQGRIMHVRMEPLADFPWETIHRVLTGNDSLGGAQREDTPQ